MTLTIKQIPCLSDNYGYLVHDPKSGETISIDSPDANAILEALKTEGWALTQIWNTHHHFDHAGGNAQLVRETGCAVIAPAGEKGMIPGADRYVGGGDTVSLGAYMARVVDTPGHTLGHICYVFDAQHIVFVGDTVFSMGCGRVFEGTPAQMWDSLTALMALPDETMLYPAHEYTADNARFALTIEPDNADLLARVEAVAALRAAGRPTVPVSLALEKKTNPFLRAGGADAFARIRRQKDTF